MSSQSVDSDRILLVEDETPEPAPAAEVVVKGRNVEIPDHFRLYVSEKLSRLERFDRTIYLFDVELDHERNRRQRKNCQHVEITARGRGPVVRGEACADSFYAALESAVCKLESRLRRSKDRRKVHYGDKTPVSLAQATALDSAARDACRRPVAVRRCRRRRSRAGPGGAHQGATGQADDCRRRALRDGARRPRFLPVPRPGERQADAWCTGGTPTTTVDPARLDRFSDASGALG